MPKSPKKSKSTPKKASKYVRTLFPFFPSQNPLKIVDTTLLSGNNKSSPPPKTSHLTPLLLALSSHPIAKRRVAKKAAPKAKGAPASRKSRRVKRDQVVSYKGMMK